MVLRLKGCTRCNGALYEDAWDKGTWYCVQCGRMYLDSKPVIEYPHSQHIMALIEWYGEEVLHLYVDEQFGLTETATMLGIGTKRLRVILGALGISVRPQSVQTRITCQKKKERGEVLGKYEESVNRLFNTNLLRMRAEL